MREGGRKVKLAPRVVKAKARINLSKAPLIAVSRR
jgi:hypothetical protein